MLMARNNNIVCASRPPRGGVSRNIVGAFAVLMLFRRPPRGGVSRNNRLCLLFLSSVCRPPRGGVSRNNPAEFDNSDSQTVAPHAGA